jgi:hypothetical protein
MKLSKAQAAALHKIARGHGHGFGEYCYLSRATADALSKMGLVVLGLRGDIWAAQPRKPWAVVADLSNMPEDFTPTSSHLQPRALAKSIVLRKEARDAREARRGQRLLRDSLKGELRRYLRDGLTDEKIAAFERLLKTYSIERLEAAIAKCRARQAA